MEIPFKVLTYNIYQVSRLTNTEGFKACPNSNYTFLVGDYPIGTAKGRLSVNRFIDFGVVNDMIVGNGIYRISVAGKGKMDKYPAVYYRRINGKTYPLSKTELSDIRAGRIYVDELIDPPDKHKYKFG